MKKILTLLAFWASMTTVFAQSSGEIKGKIVDEKGEGLIGAAIQIVDANGKNTGQGAAADIDGNYSTGPLTAGSYNVRFTSIGYQAQEVKSVVVSSDKSTFMNIQMKLQGQGVQLKTIEVTTYKKPLVDKGDTKIEQTVDKEMIKNTGGLSVDQIASGAAGVTQTDLGKNDNGTKTLTINGGRPDEVQYIVNGHRVIGNPNFATNAIKEISILTGGISAKYGDATSGFINVTLNDALQGFGGSAEVKTTQGLDKFGTTRAAANIYGPLVKIKDKTGEGPKAKRPLIGISASFQYQYDKDRTPSAIGIWQVKPDALSLIQSSPVIANPNGGINYRAQTVSFADMYKTTAKPNNAETEYVGSAELGIYPTKNLSFAVGGNIDYDTYHNFILEYSLFNQDHNPLYKTNNYYLYGRMTQRFGSQKKAGDAKAKPERTSGLKVENGFYTLQFDYEKFKTTHEDEFSGSNLWDYGYIGKFDLQQAYGYTSTVDSFKVPGSTVKRNFQGFVQNIVPTGTGVAFTPGTVNPLAAKYTQQYYQLLGATKNSDGSYTVNGANITGNTDNLTNIDGRGGLINGKGLRGTNTYVNNIWYDEGRTYGTYAVDHNDDSYRGKAEGAFDIVKLGSDKTNTHKIEMGIEYEQRIQRHYEIFPTSLWEIGRPLLRTYVADTANPIFRINGQDYTLATVGNKFTTKDTIMFKSVLSSYGSDSSFERNLRMVMDQAYPNQGYGLNGNTAINLDGINPKLLSMNLFTADELLGHVESSTGKGTVQYYGYDYKGNVLSYRPTVDDFFKAKDANGNYTRLQSAFMPTYAAGYIQDKFFYKDLGFVIGLRIDRYDANQVVLKDPYSLYDTKKAGDADVKSKFGSAIPGNIGSDYVVYINQNGKDAKITGFRNGDNWYDQYGRASSGSIVAAQSNNGLLPYLNLPGVDTMGQATAKGYIKSTAYNPSGSFTQYKAQYTFMPRLQFSFNITDKAQFFAHYDILSQRPQDRNQLNLSEYYYFTDYFAVKNNPNLKPVRKTDYEFGFKQQVASFAALTLSAFYQETRNLIQQRKIFYAYPSDYTTYDNIDFRSSKGFRLLIDMRRIQNFQFNANYTLQFVEGTGDDDNSQATFITNNNANLRSVYPLSTDARHQIKFNVDYRFDRNNYTGPVVNGYKILADFGINLGLNLRSGTPVRQSSGVVDEASISNSLTRAHTQSLSSRLPWYTRLDLRVNKDFTFKISKKSESKEAREIGISVYVLIQNLLNTENILTVYPYTLNANDDGYLSSAGSVAAISNYRTTGIQAYKDQYRARVNNPANYGLPRRIYLGANINF